MKNKLFYVSLMINLALIQVIIFILASNIEMKQDVSRAEHQTYREIIQNLFHIQSNLEMIIDSEDIDEMETSMILAQNTTYLNIRLHHKVEIPVELEILQYQLNVYFIQFQKKIREGVHDQHLQELQSLAAMLDQFKQSLNYSYYDEMELMREKLFYASKEVIDPYLKGNENPFFESE